MNILVTGGAGFIGSHLIEKLLEERHAVVCLDNFNDYYNPNIKQRNIQAALTSPDYSIVKVDILDESGLAAVFSQHHFDLIVHLAARAGVRPSIEQPLLYERVNVQGTMNLLEQCRIHHIKKFIFASSSSVYGANEKVPFEESDPVDSPISPYAATKKAAELICYTYHHLYNIKYVIAHKDTAVPARLKPILEKGEGVIYLDPQALPSGIYPGSPRHPSIQTRHPALNLKS